MKQYFTRQDLADACGVELGTITRWLRDICDEQLARRGVDVSHVRFSRREALIIADYLGFQLDGC